MAISKTRVKYLDKENKVLVKDLKDIVSNDIFSDILTPLLESDLLAQFNGLQSLLDLQSNLQDIYNFLNDISLSDFSLNKMLAGIDFSSPELAHLLGTIELIKSFDETTMAAFISAMMESVADKLYDNPSLIHIYSSVSNDARVQTILVAIDIFGSRVASGEITPGDLSRVLTGLGDLTEGLDTGLLNSVLSGIKFDTLTYDLDVVKNGDYTLPEDWDDTGVNVNPGAGDDGMGEVTIGGPGKPGNPGKGRVSKGPLNSEEGGAYGLYAERINYNHKLIWGANDEVDVYHFIEDIDIAYKIKLINISWVYYVSMRKEFYKLYMGFLSEELKPTLIQEGHDGFIDGYSMWLFDNGMTSKDLVSLAAIHNHYLSFLRVRFIDVSVYFYTRRTVYSPNYHTSMLEHIIRFIGESRDHPYILESVNADSGVYTHLADPAITFITDFVSTREGYYSEDIYTEDTFIPGEELASVLNKAKKLLEDHIDKALSLYYKKHKTKDPDKLAIPILVAQYTFLINVFSSVKNGKAIHQICYASIIATHVITNLYAITAGPLSVQAGLPAGVAVIPYKVSPKIHEYQQKYQTLTVMLLHPGVGLPPSRATIWDLRISTFGTPWKDETLSNKRIAIADSLSFWNGRKQMWYENFKMRWKQSDYRYAQALNSQYVHYKPTIGISTNTTDGTITNASTSHSPMLETPKFLNEAVDLERIQFHPLGINII